MHCGQIGPNRTERGFICPQNWHKLTQKKAQKAKNYSSKSMSHNMAQNNAQSPSLFKEVSVEDVDAEVSKDKQSKANIGTPVET